MPSSSGEKLCPICDSPIQPGSRKCGFCGTDLSIFDIDVEKPAPVQPASSPPAARPSMESRVREVLAPPPRPEPAPVAKPAPPVKEEPPPTASSFISAPEPKPAPTPAPVIKEAPPVVEPHEEPTPLAEGHEYFECPECGARVEIHASSCPGCGVMFAEEGAEMFQCPACNALVNIDSKTCPGCGAIFVESEGEAQAEEPQPQPAKVELEAPIAEVRPPPEEPVRPVAQEPEPVIAAYQEPASEPVKEAPAAKKGLGGFGWFKKRKKEPEQPVEQPVEMPPERPLGRPEPVREVATAPARTYEEQTRIPEPELERRPAPPAQPSYVSREPAPVESKDKGRELARMVAEIKPLLALANEKDIDIAESKRLIDEAAEAGRDRQLDRALEFVNRSRGILMSRIDEHLSSAIMQLKEETSVARSLGGDVSRAQTYIHEIERAKAAGDAEAAFVYADRVSNELLPITGRYKDAKKMAASLKSLVTDCETLIIDTKEARAALTEASKAFEANDFDRVEMLVKQATDRLYRAIPDRVNEEMHTAKAQLIEAKMKNVNTTPMITILKSVRTLMKAGDYQQALREMKEFKDQIRKVM